MVNIVPHRAGFAVFFEARPDEKRMLLVDTLAEAEIIKERLEEVDKIVKGFKNTLDNHDTTR